MQIPLYNFDVFFWTDFPALIKVRRSTIYQKGSFFFLLRWPSELIHAQLHCRLCKWAWVQTKKNWADTEISSNTFKIIPLRLMSNTPVVWSQRNVGNSKKKPWFQSEGQPLVGPQSEDLSACCGWLNHLHLWWRSKAEGWEDRGSMEREILGKAGLVLYWLMCWLISQCVFTVLVLVLYWLIQIISMCYNVLIYPLVSKEPVVLCIRYSYIPYSMESQFIRPLWWILLRLLVTSPCWLVTSLPSGKST